MAEDILKGIDINKEPEEDILAGIDTSSEGAKTLPARPAPDEGLFTAAPDPEQEKAVEKEGALPSPVKEKSPMNKFGATPLLQAVKMGQPIGELAEHIGKSVITTFADMMPGGAATTYADILRVGTRVTEKLNPEGDTIVIPGTGVQMNRKQFEEEKEQANQAAVEALKYAQEQQAEGAEYTEGLTKTLDDIDWTNPLDMINYVGYVAGQAGAQIPTAAATFGLSGLVLETGEIYLSSMEKIMEDKAKELGREVTLEEVVANDWDDPAVALAWGTAAASLEAVGAGKVISKISKTALKSNLAKRAFDIFATSQWEGATEGAQTIIEAIGASKAANQTWSQAFDNVNFKEILEAWVQGSIGGGMPSSISHSVAMLKEGTVADAAKPGTEFNPPLGDKIDQPPKKTTEQPPDTSTLEKTEPTPKETTKKDRPADELSARDTYLRDNPNILGETSISKLQTGEGDAVFIGIQQGSGKIPSKPLFNITKKGHPSVNSTVGVKTLVDEGLKVPEFVEQDKAGAKKPEPKTITQLEQENKQTVPKVPVANVFLNEKGAAPREVLKEADPFIENDQDLPTEEVKVADIIPTQTNLTINNLKDTEGLNDVPVLIKHDGKYYVADGHHRIANDILKGTTALDAKVYDAQSPQTSPQKPPDVLFQEKKGKKEVTFIDAAEKRALKEVKGKKIDPTLADYAIVGAAKIVRGAKDLKSFTDAMVKEFGDEVKPFVKDLHEQAKTRLKGFTDRMKLPSVKRVTKLFHDGESGANWYDSTAEELTTLFGDDAKMFSELLGATSINTTPAANVTLAQKAYALIKTGRKLEGFLPTQLTQIQRVVEGKGLKGDKIENYAKALMGDPNAIVIDSWMWRLYKGKDAKSGTDLQRKLVKQLITDQAKELGVTPRQVQAALWFGFKIEQDAVFGTEGKIESYLQNAFPDVGGVKVTDKKSFKKSLGLFTQDKGQQDAIATIYDAVAQTWAKKTGNSPDDWYRTRIHSVTTSEILTPRALAQEKAPVFYSKAAKVIDEKMPNAMDAASFINFLKKHGVKDEEIEWSGLDQLAGRITKEQALQKIEEDGVRVLDVIKGSGDNFHALKLVDEQEEVLNDKIEKISDELDKMLGPARFNPERRQALLQQRDDLFNQVAAVERERAQLRMNTETFHEKWTVPGPKTSYREFLLTLPVKASDTEQFFGPKEHGFTEANILAFVRFNERIDADGKRMLFVEEIQSDWHQRGRQRGYKKNKKLPEGWTLKDRIDSQTQKYIEVYDNNGSLRETYEAKHGRKFGIEIANRLNEGQDLNFTSPGVPDAPFKNAWQNLALKRIFRYAAENGFDRVGWTTGQQQAERYDLSKQVNKILVMPKQEISPGSRAVWIDTKESGTIQLGVDVNGTVVNGPKEFTGQKLDDVIGKELAEKAMAVEKNEEFTGTDLRVGGRGMIQFYDNMIPSAVNKLVKRYGAKAGEGAIVGDPIPGELEWLRVGEEGIKIGDIVFGSLDAAKNNFPDAVAQIEDAIAKGDSAGTVVTDREDPSVHSVDIPDKMRQDLVTEGMPLFQTKKGAVEFTADGRAIIHAFEGSDVSTAVHELSHIFRREMTKDESDLILKEIDPRSQKRWDRRTEEHFARAFEKYLRDGKAPNEQLRTVFEKFKEWLTQIYQKITGSDIDVSLTKPLKDYFNSVLDVEAAKPGDKVRLQPSTQKSEALFQDDTKKSRVFEKVKASFLSDDEVRYETVDIQEDLDKAIDFVKKDPVKAKGIALGLFPNDSGVLDNHISTVIEQLAIENKNFDQAARIASRRSLALTKAGQEIASERGKVTENSTGPVVRRLLAARRQQKNVTIENLEAAVKEAKKKVRAQVEKVARAQNILDKIAC